MNAALTFAYLLICAAIVVFVPDLVAPYVEDYGVVTRYDMAKAVLLCTAFALLIGFFIYRSGVEGSFLVQLFVAGLLVRIILGTAIFVFHGQEFFGGDAFTYDFFGHAQLQGWLGDDFLGGVADRFTKEAQGAGWGMVYMVAAIYGLIGRNMLAIQLVNSVIGSATAVVIYLCAHHCFKNLRVARMAAFAVAFYPSLVLWSSQGLKDGPIVFSLAIAILATLKLGEKLSLKYISLLIFSLLSVLSLRFYVFYMLCAAMAGTFVIGMQSVSAKSFFRQFIALLLLGVALTYFGVMRSATVQFETFANLERLQRSREDLSRSAESGYGRDVDVSTTGGALSTLPLGLVHLLFAPFPWQLASLRQSITLPEMIVWWASFPLLILGLWFGVKYRLRMISPILVFTAMLTIAYSIFQGNVGTAYRQRSQLLVFYFIFAAVGFVLVKEKREEKGRQNLLMRQQFREQQATTYGARAPRLSK